MFLKHAGSTLPKRVAFGAPALELSDVMSSDVSASADDSLADGSDSSAAPAGSPARVCSFQLMYNWLPFRPPAAANTVADSETGDTGRFIRPYKVCVKAFTDSLNGVIKIVDGIPDQKID